MTEETVKKQKKKTDMFVELKNKLAHTQKEAIEANVDNLVRKRLFDEKQKIINEILNKERNASSTAEAPN